MAFNMQGIGNALQTFGSHLAGRGPEYEERRQEQAQEQRKRRKLALLNAGDYLRQGDLNGAVNYVNQYAEQRLNQGLDAKDEMEFVNRIRGIQTPEQLQEAVRELDMVRSRAVRSGLMSAPEQAAPHTNIKILEDGTAAGYNPLTGAYERLPGPEGAKFQQGGQNINVNTAPPAPTGAFFTSAVENANETLSSFRDAATGAQSRLPAIRTLKSIDIESGFGANARLGLARATNAIFGDGAGDVFMGDVPAAEAFQALSQKMVNEELNLAKGPQTEGDAIRARQTVASLDKAPAANRFLLNYYEGLATREIERDRFFQRYMNIDPTQPDQAGLAAFREAEQAWLEFKEKTPLVARVRSDGTVVSADPNTAIPMTYYEYEKRFMQKNSERLQGMTMKEKREAAQQAWRKVNEIE